MGNVRIERIISVPRSYIWSIVGSFDKSPSKSYRLEISKHGDPDKEGIGTERILYSETQKFMRGSQVLKEKSILNMRY
ncbi:hypothetical protein [Gudongella oleilytica]|uniref:hypothetical protein n=1 Tax=Gudongella oleilytica TaxID=1582259 RepID=UPI002A36367F|nr:hypothetical protein [Gudongella oleilytica]MDY0256021.1 hypothetical protein [Gudongella oleilytica]